MQSSPENHHSNRRNFLKSTALATGALALSGSQASAQATPQKREPRKQHPIEWRNKQSGMAYRKLGATGLMVSEVVQGGSGPIKPENYKLFHFAIERGLNYFDTSSRYDRGRSEEGLGMLASEDGIRDKIFISTKVASYTATIDAIAREVMKGLPSEKQEALRKKALDLVNERGVRKPGYFFPYFGSHYEGILKAYLSLVVKQEYGYKREWKSRIKKAMMETVETSLRRLKTDYVDILHCPHGIRMPEELDDEIIYELFDTLKAQGKMRFSGFSCHTDMPRIVGKAADERLRDMCMAAYNIANQGTMEGPIERAYKDGMGYIAMKAAAAVKTGVEALQPLPEWRSQKLNTTLPGDYSLPAKAYLWALQNPHITAVNSEMYDHDMMRDNFSIVGRKVELQPA